MLPPMILGADIGGTKAVLGLFEPAGDLGGLVLRRESRLPTETYPDLESLLDDFLEAGDVPLRGAGFGIAGPVLRNRVRATNLPWLVDGDSLSRRLAGIQVALINDLEA